MLLRSSLSSNLLISLALLGLGLGNLAIGTSRIEESKPHHLEQPFSSPDSQARLWGKDLNDTFQDSQQHRSLQLEQKIEGRLDFYRTVVRGGRIFLAVGLVWLLVTLMSYAMQKFRVTQEDWRKT